MLPIRFKGVIKNKSFIKLGFPDEENRKYLRLRYFCLIEHEPVSNFEIFQIIFDYEELLKLRPLIEEGTEALISQDMNFNDFLKEWDEMRKKHYNGEITDDEFEDWKLSYPKKSRFKK